GLGDVYKRQVKDSPMVDKSWSGIFSVGVTYKF
ncbi:hypothetical protein F8O53_06810, partial [Enterobacter sp. 63]